MKLGAIYDFIVKEGMAADPRTAKQIKKKLLATKEEHKKLPTRHKKLFDKTSLVNPYSDTRILNGGRNVNVKRLMIGIDIEVGELLVANHLGQIGKKVDLVMSHHPEGLALAGLYDVMDLQADILARFGVDHDIACDLMKKRIQEVERRLHSGNHNRVVDAARLIDIPLMCCHTPTDNHVVQYLQKKFDTRRPKTLQDLVDTLLKEPEYQDAYRNKIGPKILVGKPTDKVGKVMVDMTGGTEGSKDIFARISQAGVKTLVCMHLSEPHFNKVKSEYVNVVIAGHIASDNVGINLLLDKLEKREKLDIVECSGFKRIKRR